MSQELPSTIQVVFSKDDPSGSVRVELEAYLKFNRLMDRSIENLVDRWIDDAAPNPLALRRMMHFPPTH